MGSPNGFTYQRWKSGDVVIRHNGRIATTLRGTKASKFLDEVAHSDDEQALMARVTGNYKRGNERLSAQHPRNRR